MCFLSSTDRSFCGKCLLRRRDFSVKQISSEGLEVVTLSPFCQQSSWEMSTLCQLKVMCCRYWLRLSILWVQSHMFYWNMVESSPDSNVDLTGFTLILYGNVRLSATKLPVRKRTPDAAEALRAPALNVLVETDRLTWTSVDTQSYPQRLYAVSTTTN